MLAKMGFSKKMNAAWSMVHDIADSFGDTYIGAEHLLLAILDAPDTEASKLLERMKIDRERILKIVESKLPRGAVVDYDKRQLTPRVQLIFSSAEELANFLESGQLGTHHVLHALSRSDHYLVCDSLEECSFKPNKALRMIAEMEKDGSIY